MTTRPNTRHNAYGELLTKLLGGLPSSREEAASARDIATKVAVDPHLASVRLGQLAREGRVQVVVDLPNAFGAKRMRYYRVAALLLLALGACGRDATAPAFECTPVAVSAADSIPASLIPQVVVCVEAQR